MRFNIIEGHVPVSPKPPVIYLPSFEKTLIFCILTTQMRTLDPDIMYISELPKVTQS